MPRAKGQAANLAGLHSDKIDRALHKGGDFIDSRTRGKYSDKITRVRTSARAATDKARRPGRSSAHPTVASGCLRECWHVLAVDVDPEGLRDVCERYGVASLEVFGSVGRGEDQGDSDVDLLYVFTPGTRLGFRLFDLEDELAALFGRPVDLVSRRSTNTYLREQVLAEAQPLYAARTPAAAARCATQLWRSGSWSRLIGRRG